MASATRLPLKTVGFTAALILATSASRVNIKKLLESALTGPGSYSRIAVAILLLFNLKNVPWAWHLRVFNSIFKHCLISKPNMSPQIAGSALFLPVITASHSPLTECDYNLHKSNSTYFSDLDVTRSHLVCCLLQPGIHRLHNNKTYKEVLDPTTGMPARGRWNIMLGAVACSFKREIGIYEGYEMWSRVLCWDRKWIFVVTHFVKRGTVRPTEYILTDGSWFGGNAYKSVKGKSNAELDEKAIFASAISKYVVKLGRLTVHPEVLLNASGVLPERPGGWHTMSGVSGESTPESLENETDGVAANGSANGSVHPPSSLWDWKSVEAERLRGLKYAEHFQALDGLHQEFSGSRGPALGKYRDFIL